MPTYCQQLPESLLSKSPLHDRKIEDPEDNFNMSPHVLTCIELRHTHNVILFSFAIFHACSTYMFNECTGDSAHGPLWSPLIGFQQEKLELVYAHAQRKMDDWRSAQWHVFGCLVDGLFWGVIITYYYICIIWLLLDDMIGHNHS